MRILKTMSLAVVCATVAAASVNNCPNTTDTENVNNGFDGGTTGSFLSQTVPGTGPGNSLLNGATGLGCTAVDLSFSNFAVSGTGGTNGAITAASTYVAETPAGTTNNPLTNPDTLIFSSVRGTGVGTDGGNTDGRNNFFTNTSTAISDNVSYVVQAAAGSAIYSIVLVVNAPGIDTGTTGSFTFNVCTGGSETGIVTGTCSSGATVNKVFTLTGTTSASETFTLNFASPVTYADVTTEIKLSSGTSGNFAGFATFSEELTESPEPSSFVLLGSALAGLAALQFRKRKQQV